MPGPFTLCEPSRLRAEAQGARGVAWIAGLGGLVASLERDWGFKALASLEGGSEGLVLRCHRSDGSEAIVKCRLPQDDTDAWEREVRVLERAGGQGYVKLLADDSQRQAMMLEPLGAPLASLGLSVTQQIEIICTTLKTAWRPLDRPDGLMSGADKALWLGAAIEDGWHRHGHPCAAATIERAVSYTNQRAAAHDPKTAMLVHGDAHAFNTLQGAPDGGDGTFKFIDPDGLFAEPAYDLAIPMREWAEDLMAGDALARGRDRAALLADLTGVSEQAIWQWGFIERVSTGLHILDVGRKKDAEAYLQVADLWAEA